MAKPVLVAKSAQRTGALTSTYDATPTCIPINTTSKAYIAMQYTKQSSTSALVKIEFSFDETNSMGLGGNTQTNLQGLTYYRLCQLGTTSASGTNTQDAAYTLNTLEISLPGGTDNYLFPVPAMATAVRVNARSVGAVSGTMSIFVVSGNTD